MKSFQLITPVEFGCSNAITHLNSPKTLVQNRLKYLVDKPEIIDFALEFQFKKPILKQYCFESLNPMDAGTCEHIATAHSQSEADTQMELNWQDIRIRASKFASDWEGKSPKVGQTQLFYKEFFEIFGASVQKIATFEQPIKKPDGKYVYLDLFWPGILLVEQKSIGHSLTVTMDQALKYFPYIKKSKLPQFLLVSDFQNFKLRDMEEGVDSNFSLSELPQNVEKLAFIIGQKKKRFKDQAPVNIIASELIGNIHDELKANGYRSPNLERFLIRIVFCMFADNTGLFEFKNMFLELLETRSHESGEDLGMRLIHLFQILNQPVEERDPNLPPEMADFPYVDGRLFLEPISIPSFNAKMRKSLIEACRFDWSGISPAVFGSLFQFVLDKEERREQGAHYTSEKNILKVLEPMFMSDLWAEFKRLRSQKGTNRRRRLQEFHKRLSQMTFFDPACGCGNFLVIAYRELRLLEIELIREIRPYRASEDQPELDTSLFSLLNVDQFYGIELNEFAVRIAESALWMMDHIMNNRLSLELGQSYARIPLTRTPNIIHGDALELDWEELLPSHKCSHVIGNPPFKGSNSQSELQRSQVRSIAKLGNSRGTLDYVAAWFIKSAAYIQKGDASIGFVATNSITQGEQVAKLWPVLLDEFGLEISFAHRTFAWESEARGKAHVHVVIIGLSKQGSVSKNRVLFSYDSLLDDPHQSSHTVLSPYLFDGAGLDNPNTVVKKSTKPLNGLPEMSNGSQPIDDSNYIFSDRERSEFLKEEPKARKYFHQFIGSEEFLHGQSRWILSLQNAEPEDFDKLPKVRERIELVRSFRMESERENTRKLSDYPRDYSINKIPTAPFLVIPAVSSERREYVPIGWLEPPDIPSNAVLIVENAELFHFGLLTSSMHMSWLRQIGGRLKSDYRYSKGLVYNTFPMPNVTKSKRSKIEELVLSVLNARKYHDKSTLAELYNTETMPTDLRRAHAALDRAVDQLYSRKSFESERKRVEFLLAGYEKMVSNN